MTHDNIKGEVMSLKTLKTLGKDNRYLHAWIWLKTLQLLTMIEKNMLLTQVSSLGGRLETIKARYIWVQVLLHDPVEFAEVNRKGIFVGIGKEVITDKWQQKWLFFEVSIAVSATVTDPTEDVKAMSPERRKCLLESETSSSLYKVHFPELSFAEFYFEFAGNLLFQVYKIWLPAGKQPQKLTGQIWVW